MSSKEKENKPKGMGEYKQEFMPPVELKTDPDYLVKFPDLVVAGHKVTPREADIFYIFHTSHNTELVLKQFGMTRQNFWDMQKRAWWKRWTLDQLKDWMDTTRNHFLSTGWKLMEAQQKYLENPNDYPPSYGMAIAKMIETHLRASPEGIRPTLVSKFEIEHETKIQETIDIRLSITSDKIKKLSPEAIDEWNLTGVIPQELNELRESAIDTDFEDINGGEEDEEAIDPDDST